MILLPLLALVQLAAPIQPQASTQSLQRQLNADGARAEQRVRILEILAFREGDLSYQAISPLRKIVRGDLLIDYTRCLGRCGPEGLPELYKLAKKSHPVIRAEAVYGIILNDQAKGERFARGVLRSVKEPSEAKVAALRALADRGSILARVEAVRRLATAHGGLLLEALDTLARDPQLEDVRYLIDVVATRSGRPRTAAVDLLQQITNYRIGEDARTWRYFMLKHKVEGTDFHREEVEQERQTETLSYLGIPILGEQVVFVLDASGSMNAPLAERSRQSRGARAVDELAALLPRLPHTGSFDIVFFESRVDRFSSGKLVPCAEAQVASATSWLDDRIFDGGTNLHGGLEEAFSRPDVEEIIVLTDGMPSAGEVQDPSRILAWVKRWNRFRKIRVSSIALSAPHSASSFLYELAKGNHGAFRAIR